MSSESSRRDISKANFLGADIIPTVEIYTLVYGIKGIFKSSGIIRAGTTPDCFGFTIGGFRRNRAFQMGGGGWYATIPYLTFKKKNDAFCGAHGGLVNEGYSGRRYPPGMCGALS